GLRFRKDSWTYQVLREWIAQGAKRQSVGGVIEKLEVWPREYRLSKPGETIQLKVLVQFADGAKEDLTPFCDFRIKNDAIAEVAPSGVVRGLAPGDTALVVSYRGHLITSRILVPAPVALGFVYPQAPEVNVVDREVFAKLRQLNLLPSELSSDAEFLRRV